MNFLEKRQHVEMHENLPRLVARIEELEVKVRLLEAKQQLSNKPAKRSRSVTSKKSDA